MMDYEINTDIYQCTDQLHFPKVKRRYDKVLKDIVNESSQLNKTIYYCNNKLTELVLAGWLLAFLGQWSLEEQVLLT